MYRNQRERPVNPETGKAYRSRLDEVLAMLKARAMFWNRTSISVFLAGLAFVGIIFLYLAWGMVGSGQVNIQILNRMAPPGSWSFMLCAIGMLGFGINLIIPLPLYWLIEEKRVLQVTIGLLVLNILIFGYGYLLGSISLTTF